MMTADLIASMRAAYRGCGPDHSVNRLLDYVEALERLACAVVTESGFGEQRTFGAICKLEDLLGCTDETGKDIGNG